MTGLSGAQHGIALIIGAGGLLVTVLVRVVPIELIPSLDKEEALSDEQREVLVYLLD